MEQERNPKTVYHNYTVVHTARQENSSNSRFLNKYITYIFDLNTSRLLNVSRPDSYGNESLHS